MFGLCALGIILLIRAYDLGNIRAPEKKRSIATYPSPYQLIYFPVAPVAPRSIKRGGAFTSLVPGDQCKDARALNVAWFYNWSTGSVVCPGIEFVPMIWGAGSRRDKIAGDNCILELNEPDRPDQSNLSPQQAALIIRDIETLHPKRCLISPAPSQLNFDWLSNTRAEYLSKFGEYPRWSALAVHCYASDINSIAACNVYFDNAIRTAREWGLPGIWITEFAIIPGVLTDQEIVSHLSRWIIEIEKKTGVIRYALFVNRWSHEIDYYCPVCSQIALIENNNLTPLGIMFSILR